MLPARRGLMPGRADVGVAAAVPMGCTITAVAIDPRAAAEPRIAIAGTVVVAVAHLDIATGDAADHGKGQAGEEDGADKEAGRGFHGRVAGLA